MSQSTTSSLSGLRVLVIEDEMLVAMMVQDMLSDMGCEMVGHASRLAQAIALLDQVAFDCALLDVNLAGQRVDPLVDLLKARGRPFAFATGYGPAGLRAEDRSWPVLQKPFTSADLAEILIELRTRN